MASFAGLRGTGDWGTDERPKNFREMILWANPNGMAPVTAFLSKMRSEKTDDPEFSWWQEKLELVRVSINYSTGYISTATSFAIDANGLALVPGDLLQVEKTEVALMTNEIVMVSSITSDTAIVVQRGVAGSTPETTIADDAFLTKIGNAFEEGTGRPNISQRNPTKVRNYTQIFKTTFGSTRTAQQTRARTGDAFNNDKKRKMFDHSIALELAFMFGRPYEEATGPGGKPRRYTGGLRHFIQTNNTIYTTSPTEDTFIDAIRPVFDFNVGGSGDERLVVCGNGFLVELNKIVRNSSNTQIRYDGPFKVYGMNLQRWILPMGTLGIKTHPLMNQHGLYNYSAFVIDPRGLIYRPMLDTTIKKEVQDNDSDSREDMWITECGLELEHEYTMAYLGNFKI